MASEATPTDVFAAWVGPCLPAMQRYAARLVAPGDRDDLMQEALLRAWRRWDTYDAERGEPLPWLLAVLADRARRRRRIRRPSMLLFRVDEAARDRAPDVDLERALLRLSARQRQAVDLYYFLDLDVETTARAMECAPGTVRATLHQARAALRTLLEDDDA